MPKASEMNSLKNTITGLILDYDSGIVPPPYSHVFHLELDWSKGNLDCQLELHYTDREDLSEEEILDEGFSLQDDYSYKGSLNKVWVKPLEELFQKTKWTNKDIDEGGITITPTEKGKDLGLKIPSNQEEWQLMAQDLIQAIYETVKREAPLKVNYRKVDHETTTDCSLTVHFSNREVVFEKNGKSRIIHWEYAIQLMKMIFTPDYHYELAKDAPGTKRGEYIDCGDGYWHQLGKGVDNIDPSFDAVGKIRQGFEELLED